VVQADGKGVVMRRPADEPKIHAHRTEVPSDWWTVGKRCKL
jgi:hypothetical protein